MTCGRPGSRSPGCSTPGPARTSSGSAVIRASGRSEPRAARFFPRHLPDDVLATGGIAGDGSHEELIAHAGAVGREAARRAARIRRERQAAVPTRAPANGAERAGDDAEPEAIPE